MKQISMTELTEGDIFAFEMKFKGRMAFLVEKVKEGKVLVTKRNGDVTQKPVSKKIEGKVWLSRNLKNASK